MSAIDFTEAEVRAFSPSIRKEYLAALMRGKADLRAAGILENGKRFAHFMGQVGGETSGGVILRESLNYKTVKAIRGAWRARASKHSDAWIKANLLGKPVALGDWAYGGRMGNRKGTTDGYDYRGGGFIQTTGRWAVENYCKKCGIPIRPDILDDYDATLKFACAEWVESNCNKWADQNDIMAISKEINTGSATSGVYPNGMEHRRRWFEKARKIWWDAEPQDIPESVENHDMRVEEPVITEHPVTKAPLETKDIVRQSRKLTVIQRVRDFLKWAAASVAGMFTLDQMGAVQGLMNNVQNNAFYVLLVFGGLAWLIATYLKERTIEDAQEGRYVPSGAASADKTETA